MTRSDSRLDNTPFQKESDLHQNTYPAVNLIWYPIEGMFWGIEYLYGPRTNINQDTGHANRIQISFGFNLP